MTPAEEKAYKAGQDAAARRMLLECARELGFENPLAKVAALIEERAAAVQALRRLCERAGDNDWPDELHLSDVIEKHLAVYVEETSDA